MKHVFIVNPTSGKGNYKVLVDWVENNLEKDAYDLVYTNYVGHAKDIAESYGPDVILYAVGGDGTAHEVLNGMDQNATLSIIPTGTGNDFYKMIGNKKDLVSIIEKTVLHGVTRKIDVGKVNGNLFLNSTSIGVDADVNLRANKMRMKYIPRQFVYLISALREVFSIKTYNIEIKENGTVKKNPIALLSVMNGMFYGNGFKSAPEAKIDDGLLDLCLVSPVTTRRAFVLLPKYNQGKHLKLKEVTYRKIDKLEIMSEQPLVVACDGEIFETNHLQIEVVKDYLNLRIPA